MIEANRSEKAETYSCGGKETDMGKISLVIVEDHPVMLAGIQQLFKKQGDFEVVGAA